MKIKTSRVILYIALFIMMISLFYGTDLFNENISGHTYDLSYYFRTIMYCIILAFVSKNATFMINKKVAHMMFYASMMCAIIPYGVNTVLNDIHVFLMYCCIFAMTISWAYVLWIYRIYNYKLAQKLILLFLGMIFMEMALYISFFDGQWSFGDNILIGDLANIFNHRA